MKRNKSVLEAIIYSHDVYSNMSSSVNEIRNRNLWSLARKVVFEVYCDMLTLTLEN